MSGTVVVPFEPSVIGVLGNGAETRSDLIDPVTAHPQQLRLRVERVAGDGVLEQRLAWKLVACGEAGLQGALPRDGRRRRLEHGCHRECHDRTAAAAKRFHHLRVKVRAAVEGFNRLLRRFAQLVDLEQ